MRFRYRLSIDVQVYIFGERTGLFELVSRAFVTPHIARWRIWRNPFGTRVLRCFAAHAPPRHCSQ